MTGAVTIHRRVYFQRMGRRKVLRTELAPVSGRVPRVARLMALAIRLEELVRTRRVADYAALAKLGHVTRARITQITNLTLLAPDIQEGLLFLPPVRKGPEPITERHLRLIVAELAWNKQRELWAKLNGHASSSASRVRQQVPKVR